MKRKLRETQNRVKDLMKELQDYITTPEVSKIDVGDGFHESFSSVIEIFLPKLQYLVKKITHAADSIKVPKKDLKKKKPVMALNKSYKLSTRTLKILKTINPKETEFVFDRGGKIINSRSECASILIGIRRLERDAKKKEK